MTANDWLVIERARARREGLRRGAWLALLPSVMLGGAIMLAVHLGLTFYAGSVHDETVRLLTVERDTCRADVAKYADVAAVEQAYANRRAYP